MGRLGRRLALMLFLIGGITFVFALIRYREWLLHRPLDWWVAIFTIFGSVAALAGLMPRGDRTGIARFLRRPQPPTADEIATARKNLHAALSGAWSDDVSEVYEDEPMHVRFTVWPPDADQLQAGDFESVAEAFARKPRYRRVVLGTAGSGKSVLMAELQRKLVEAPSGPDEPLPVIVRAGAWRPKKQPLLDWLAQQLATDYGWLPVSHARALIARGMVLPILDGLDEMPSGQQRAAIARINKHHIYRPLILTSREREFARAVAGHGADVKHAAVVAVQPLLPDAIKDYLDPTGRGGWTAVLSDLNADDVLADVLANPLMLYLARVEYTGRNPENLTLIDNKSATEKHLLREFVPAVYREDPRQPDIRRFHCSAQQAMRWLGHLAWPAYRAQTRQGSRDDDPSGPVLAWWKITGLGFWWSQFAIWIRAAALFSVATALAILVLKRQGNWRDGGYSGPVNLDQLVLDGPVGRLVRPTMHTLARAFRKDIGNHLNAWFHGFDVVRSHPVLLVGAAALLVLIVATFSSSGQSRAPVRLRIRAVPMLRYALRRCPRWLVVAVLASVLCLYFAHWPVGAGAFFGSRTTWITFLAVCLLPLTGISRTFFTKSDKSGSLSPAESLRLDRISDATVTVSRRATVIVAVWLVCGPPIATAYAAYAVAATVVALAAGRDGSFASRSYTQARLLLAARGYAPWRILAFLSDASDRGVLRQVGATYQFRHARLVNEVPDWLASPGRASEVKSSLTRLTSRILKGAGLEQPLVTLELDVIREDVLRYLALARTRPERFRPEFAATLDELAGRLWRYQDERGRDVVANLLATYRALARTDAKTFLPGMVRALRDLRGGCPWDDALALALEAADAYKELADADPDQFLPGQALAVCELARQLSELERTEDALLVGEEIVAALRSAAHANPGTFLPVLARSLASLADLFHPAESVRARADAVAVYRQLAAREPGRFLSHLSASLDALAAGFAALERRADELTAIRQALHAYQARAERIARARRLIAASALADTGRVGVRARGTAASVSRRAAGTVAPELLPDLAEAVRGVAAELKSAGKPLRAWIMAREADGIDPDPRDRRTRSLERMADLALRLWKLGEHAEALAAARTRRDLAPRERDARLAHARVFIRCVGFSCRLAWESAYVSRQSDPAKLERHGDILDTFAFRLRAAGYRAYALGAAEEAVNARSKAVSRPREADGPADSALLRLTAAADLLAGRQPAPAQEPTSSPAPSG